MPIPSRARHLLSACLIAALLLLGGLTISPVFAAQDAKTAAAQADARQKLADLRSKMEALAKEQAQTAAKRDSVNAELAKQADAVAAASRAVRDTDTQIAAKQHDLDQLQVQRTALNQSLDSQRAAIGDLLRAIYTLGHGSDLRLLLGDDDVARVARALAYSKYFQQDRVQKVQQLMDQLSKLQELEASITSEQQALQATLAQRQQQAQALQQQRSAQQKLAAQVDTQYKSEADRLAAMKQNAQSLDGLLAKLQKAIDDAAREAARQARSSPGQPVIVPGKGFANIRGNLPWPATGSVHSFGNGVLIAAPRGSDVHAVAHGRVVYAHYLRGYGLLIILNHGDGWMSMYGNNESLLRNVGDDVQPGEALGTASLTTGDTTGVYFELRHDSKPVDPRSWLGQQR